jgi:hypothetical protein
MTQKSQTLWPAPFSQSGSARPPTSGCPHPHPAIHLRTMPGIPPAGILTIFLLCHDVLLMSWFFLFSVLNSSWRKGSSFSLLNGLNETSLPLPDGLASMKSLKTEVFWSSVGYHWGSAVGFVRPPGPWVRDTLVHAVGTPGLIQGDVPSGQEVAGSWRGLA